MGFTKSKDDPNLYMNIMDDEPVILLMYVDDLFLTRNKKRITDCKKKLTEEFKMKIYWIDALFPRVGSVAEPRKNIYESGKVCSRNLENI